MADLNVERKERSTPWIWIIIGIIVLALLAWWLLGRDTAPAAVGVNDTAVVDTTRATPAAAALAGAPSEVNDFIGFVEENRTRDVMGREHEYTADALRRLASAVDAIAQRENRVTADVRQRTDSIRAHADALQREEQSSQHASQARLAFVHAVEAVQRLDAQLGQRASAQVGEMRSAADALNADTQLLNQRAQVHRFFDAASNALQNIAQGDTAPGTVR